MASDDHPAPTIEMIAGGFSPVDPVALERGRGGGAAVLLVAVLVVSLGVALAVLPSSFERPESAPTAARPESDPATRPTPDLSAELPATLRQSTTHLVEVPGQVPVIAGAEDLAIVYVSTRGFPTVVDLGTGHRSELTLDAATDQYDFALESGRVVSRDPLSAGRVRAGPDAIDVHVSRPQLLMRGEAAVVDSTIPAITFGELAGTTVAPLRGFSEPVMSSITELTDWRQSGRWIVAPDASLRIPAPDSDGVIWLVRGPRAPTSPAAPFFPNPLLVK